MKPFSASVGLASFGHLVTIDDELVCHLVSLWDESRGCFKAIGLAGGAERAGWCKQRCGDEGEGKDGRKVTDDARHEWNRKEILKKQW